MSNQPNILVTGILDTKGQEIKYIANRVKESGGKPIIMEISVGNEVGWADISITKVLANIGKTKEEIFALDRGKAADFVISGAIKVTNKLYRQNKIDGIISYGGSMGASIATAVMRTLPIGFPKMMLTTMASGDVEPYVGTKDICMMYPIAEAGLNKVTKPILNNAAASIVGMTKAHPIEQEQERELIGCTMFGVTTPCVLRASKQMENRNYDVIINHAVGSGGRSMEELINEGYISGILDITTHEIADYLLGGVLSAGPNRLTAAGKKGIPQIIAPGGLDLINFGPIDTIPKEHMDKVDTPGKSLYVHNPNVTCIGVSPKEAYKIGEHISKKINLSKGPTAICVPLRGWGACDISKPNKELGWAGPGAGPVWIPYPNRPEWSLRSIYFAQAIIKNIDKHKSNVEVILLDKHMNEPEVADLMVDLLAEMLNNNWKKGRYTNLPYIINHDNILE